MGRSIPIQLQQAMDSGITTMTLILKISPVTPGYSPYGVTFGNRDVIYDNGDGDGALRYSAAVGMQPTAVSFRGDMSVDNAEYTSLIPEFDIPVSEEDIRAGAYDFAEFTFLLVDYQNLDYGHITLQEGTIGEITIDANGLSAINELRGIIAQLKQSLCEKDSLTCRARFGSQPPGSPIPGPQVKRGWCGFDAESLFVEGEVLSLGLENTLTFSISADSDMADDSLAPGLVTWLTGMNAGRSKEIDSNTAGGQITLRFETDFPIQVGDTLKYRPDCNHLARDDVRGCRRWFESEWVLHFRGEPDIPIGDAGTMETPNASSPPGQGGTTFQPADIEEI